jgi:hypothetical protein
MSNAHRFLVALILLSPVAGHAGLANADAISDQKTTNKCTFFTKADAERALHGPVVYVPAEIDPTNCAWALEKDPSIGVTVSRETPPLYPPMAKTPGVNQIHHVTGVGKDAYTYYANAGAGGVYTADVLTSKGVTSVTLPEKAGNAATALAIARMMMNR